MKRAQVMLLAAALLVGGTHAVEAQLDHWPMIGQNAQHSGFTTAYGPVTSAMDWSSGYGASGIAIGSDAVYTTGNGVTAIGFDGGKKWTFHPPSGSTSWYTPAVGEDADGNETVYVPGYSMLCAVDPSNPVVATVATQGDYGILLSGLKWTYPYTAQIQGSLTLAADGSILLVAGDRHLHHVNSNGTLRRKVAPSGNAAFQGTAAVSADGATIYVRSSDKYLYAYNNSNGSLKWKYKISSAPNDPVVGNDGTIYFSGQDYTLWAINSNGTKKWSVAIGKKPQGGWPVPHQSLPAIDAATNRISVGGADGLYNFNASGVKQWTVLTNGLTGTYSRPAIGADGTIYFNRNITPSIPETATMFAVSANGTPLWVDELRAWTTTDVAIRTEGTETLMYVGSGRLYCYRDGGDERPTLGSMALYLNAIRDDTITEGEEFEIRTGAVVDTDGTIAKMEFFIDSDGNGALNPADEENPLGDLKIGESTTPAYENGYKIFYTPPQAGEYLFFTRALDNDGKPSNVRSQPGTVLPAP
jgi:outer membrane protein assembly factor BamB